MCVYSLPSRDPGMTSRCGAQENVPDVLNHQFGGRKPGPKRQGHSPFSMLEKNWGIAFSSVRACLSENSQRKDLLLLPIAILFLQSLEFPYT